MSRDVTFDFDADEPAPTRDDTPTREETKSRPLPKYRPNPNGPLAKHHREMKALAQHSTNSVEHYTPSEYVESARALMGGIELDPASSFLANQTIKAERFYGLIATREDGAYQMVDGLAQQWTAKTVLLNPPGGKTETHAPHLCGITKSFAAIWWGKLVSEWKAGRVGQAVFFGFTLELLRSCQKLQGVSHPLTFPHCIPAKRMRFDYPLDTFEGRPMPETEIRKGNSPTHANFVVWLPPFAPVGQANDPDAQRVHFAHHFEKYGFCG